MTLAAPALVLRPAVPSDAPACHRLSQAVSWPHRIADWEMVLRLGRGVVITEGETVVASALWWPYGDRHATLGMIIVEPGRQGGGLGKRLMQGVLDQAGARDLMLNATVAGQPLYERFGFVPCGEVRQYHGVIGPVPGPALAAGQCLRPATGADLPVLLRLDTEATGLPRRAALEALLAIGEAVILEQAGEPVGYSLTRPFGRGRSIGPVVAPDSDTARLLIGHWLNAGGEGFVRVDIPGGTGLEGWLEGHGLRFAGGVTAMVRGAEPQRTGPARRFGLINQALG